MWTKWFRKCLKFSCKRFIGSTGNNYLCGHHYRESKITGEVFNPETNLNFYLTKIKQEKEHLYKVYCSSRWYEKEDFEYYLTCGHYTLENLYHQADRMVGIIQDRRLR
jgi:hypothetical protein